VGKLNTHAFKLCGGALHAVCTTLGESCEKGFSLPKNDQQHQANKQTGWQSNGKNIAWLVHTTSLSSLNFESIIDLSCIPVQSLWNLGELYEWKKKGS
jgi:hypothetical protein